MPTKRIIKNDTLFFNRDNQRGGILFDSVIHPLQKLFSKESIKELKKNSSTNSKNSSNSSNSRNSSNSNSMIRATDSTKYDRVRKKKDKNKTGGYMTNLFFPAGYSAAASTLGLYTLNHASGKNKSKRKTSRTKNKK